MDTNINTQHALFCTTSSTKSQEASTIQGPQYTVAIALDMSKVFDTVTQTYTNNIPNIIIKFITNYIKE